jgi:hypothetical protein
MLDQSAASTDDFTYAVKEVGFMVGICANPRNPSISIQVNRAVAMSTVDHQDPVAVNRVLLTRFKSLLKVGIVALVVK